jgi:hypothetical protein
LSTFISGRKDPAGEFPNHPRFDQKENHKMESRQRGGARMKGVVKVKR